MNISPEEAQASLAAIQQTRAKMHRLASISGYYLVIWGSAWFFGCLGNQFLPADKVWIVWAPACTIGWILSAFLGTYQGRQMRAAVSARIGFFYLALFGFAALWYIIMQPVSGKQTVLFIVTLFMFAGVTAGIMTRVVPTIIGSLSIAALAVIGYYLLPTYFNLWVAVFCGLTMVGIGLGLLLRRR
jgi:hypothetical protein